MQRLIEEMKYEDFREMSEIIPKRLPLGEIEAIAKKIAKKYDIPILDAKGCIFIAFTIVQNESIQCYEHARTQRVAEIARLREA